MSLLGFTFDNVLQGVSADVSATGVVIPGTPEVGVISGMEEFVGDVPSDTDLVFVGFGGYTLVQSTEHVTQGQYSGLFTGDPADGVGFATNYDADLTAYNTIFLDVTVTDVEVDGYVSLYIEGIGGSPDIVEDTTTIGATGTYTLEVDISTFSDKTQLYVSIASVNCTTSYIDNFRGE